MTKQLLYYENAVPVSAQRHRDWSLAARTDFEFAAIRISCRWQRPSFRRPRRLRHRVRGIRGSDQAGSDTRVETRG